MAITYHNVDIGTYFPNPDFQAGNSDTGAWQASQSFMCREETLDDDAFRNTFKGGATPRDLDASISTYWDFLGLSGINWSLQPGGLARITARFYGFSATGSGGPTAEVPRYSLRGVVEERSILDHPTVVALTDAQRANIKLVLEGEIKYDGTDFYYQVYDAITGDEGKATITAPTSTYLTFMKIAARGIQTYKAPVITWRKDWSSDTGLASGDLSGLGSNTADPDGSEPSFSGSRDWLQISCSQEQLGNLYQNSVEWLLSEPNGWDDDIY